ncbi:hypothetical protein HPB51_022787 [Rhipicephalus microplus]|uniref:Exportin-1 n=1 Tax=Rhipicephalus microplus TaxID=6941 RepID=A0A9J6ECW6_RHIMP|nr:hypothetical protein HPB51_022787 [Rhipicephalus microplus]
MSAPEPLKQLSQIPMTGSAPLVSALDSPKSVCKQAPTAAVNGSMNALSEQAARLLDFSQKLDINLLDSVVCCMYTGEGPQQRLAQEVLTTLKEHPEAWTRVDTILEFSKNQQTKYYALQILENVIKTRWRVLPRNQCEGIKKYIVGLIIKTSSDPESIDRERVYLNKLNMILVQVCAFCRFSSVSGPRTGPRSSATSSGASKTNESLCQNNMIILKLLSEEVFDFSSGQMTQAKAKHLKDTMCNEFSHIFQLCQFVMENSQNALLVHATLETLLRFLNWIPLGYIFETKLISTLIYKFLNVPLFRNVTLKCLTEISGVNASHYDEMFVLLFTQTMAQLEQMLPPTTVIKEAYSNGQDDEQKFIQNLSLFLCTYLKEHGALIEKRADLLEVLHAALHYLLLISEVEEVEIFKICLEYWNALASDLYREIPYGLGTGAPLYVGGEPARRSPGSPQSARRLLYGPVLTKQKLLLTQFELGSFALKLMMRLFFLSPSLLLLQLRYIMIGRMAKPEEVIVVENEQGEVVREFMKDTDAIQLYKNMRETLVYLTHLDYLDTERIMTEKLHFQVNGTEWSWKNLNTLCWAIGSISGAMHEEDEKRFLVTVIKDLLGLCEQKRGKDNKAIIASNIMYVVGQYPRFLRAHWKFLKTVVNKLFEFMHETHEGVQDMACDTFIKIAQKCRRHFVQVQVGEAVPFIEEILANMSSIIYDLQPQQVHTFCEAVGYMISAQADQAQQERLVDRYMLLPNQVWDDIIKQASKNVDVLKDPDAVRQLGNILKTNVRACKALGHPVCNAAGPHLPGHAECLQVLLDYQRCTVPAAREPEVLSAMSMIVHRLEGFITCEIPKIFDAVFECTLSMINKDFEEFPEHRTNFFLLLQAVVTHCFPALLNIPPAQFKLVLDSIIWAFKHTMRNVADVGLQILYQLLQNIGQEDVASQSFYQTYYTDIMQHLFSVVTDTSHTAGLSMQASILAYMFSIVEANKVTVPLNPTMQANGITNVVYVQDFVANLLKTAFSHLSDAQVKITVQGFFNLNQDIQAFKEHLRDFLVQIREYTGEDDSDLFLEEREAALRQAEEEKRKIRMLVPGILNPHEIPEEMQD